MKLALIGNCAYQALIDDRANVVWLCWPRFDSSFVFGSLVDAERGGQFAVEAAGDYRTTQDYLPNTNILRTVFEREGDAFEVVDFAPRFQQYERYYKPTMLVRRLRRLSGEPVVRVRCDPTTDYGRSRPDAYVASNHIQWLIPGAQLRLTTNVPLSYIRESREFLLERDAYVVLTWGSPLEAPLAQTCETFLTNTRRYWEAWVKHTALPGSFQREVIRSALALKLHQYEDTGAITAATTTSIPEHLGSGRNWDYRYCWLRDSYFTLRAMRRIGHFEEMEQFVSFLKNLAEASPEHLQPVYGISGERELHEEVLSHLGGYQGSGPVRIGNAAYAQHQHDVYGEMIAAIAPMYLDVRFADHQPAGSVRLLRRLLTRLAETMEQPDAGIWEIRGDVRTHTFSLLMHWVGAVVAARIAQQAGAADIEGTARGLAARARSIMIERCYRSELGYYADSTATDNPDASLLMMINLGFLRRGHPHAEPHLRALARELKVRGPLLHRYRHHDGIGETLATFTVCGFWYVEALARLGFVAEAERGFEELMLHANHVGLFSEDLDPVSGEQLGNFPQTYSHVGLINAAFAISPLPLEVGDP
ncbi:MAG: glycoside hydrolase family 15 protein [Myxococcales bacterium]|nr:glycoside hydrolase family 15 protein [Myxococcales bacterium]MCB9581048.1 glycoside hydrolase family 15 protein [Polyangiaceae bacterium]